jgi:hypothetical protein
MLADLVKQILLCHWRPERGVVIREKLCPQCDRYKPIEAFGTKGTRRQSWCFVCVRENNRKAYRRKA